MSELPIAAIPGHTDQAMPPRPELAVVDPPQTLTMEDINLAMRESLQRTARLSPLDNHIPPLDPSVLEEGNQRVLDQYGDDARRLLIIGPDVVSFEGLGPTVLERQYSGRILGAFILVREMSPSSVYHAMRAYPADLPVNKIRKRFFSIRDSLREELIDHTGHSAISRTGKRGGVRSGMPDVVVKDMRANNPQYDQVRSAEVTKAANSYLERGGGLPAITNIGDLRAVQKVMRQFARYNIDRITSARFRELNQLITEHLEHRTELYNADYAAHNPVNTARINRARGAIASLLTTSWGGRAVCVGNPALTKLFFAPDNERKGEQIAREAKAKAVCATCPVAEQCANYAIRNRVKEGVWGGKNTVELGITKRRKSSSGN